MRSIQSAGKWNTLIQQGSTFVRTLNFGQVDLSEWDFRGQIRRSHSDTNVLAEYQFEKISSSEVVIRLSAAATEAIPEGQWVHDIEVVSTVDAFVARVLEGRVRVTPEVTREVPPGPP